MTDWEAVFWDIGGVILDSASLRDAQRAFVGWLVDEYDSDRSTAEAFDRWQATLSAYFGAREGTEFLPARVGYARAIDAILGDAGGGDADASETVAWQAQYDACLARHLRPKPHAVETIHALTDLDLHLGVVSDIDTREGAFVLETFGVRDAFDSVTTSEAVGRTKPNASMFETALDAAQVPPEHALMIGDRYRHDIEGASRVGLTTVAYGAADGPAVEYRIDSLDQVLDIVRGDRLPDGDAR